MHHLLTNCQQQLQLVVGISHTPVLHVGEPCSNLLFSDPVLLHLLLLLLTAFGNSCALLVSCCLQGLDRLLILTKLFVVLGSTVMNIL